MSKFVHWEEGLLLRPQHLQRMQKALTDHVAADRRLAWVYPSGVVEAKLQTEGLKNFNVQFTSLRAVMPSGVVVDYPAAAEIDQPLNVRACFGGDVRKVRVFLAVPVWQNERANTMGVRSQQAATDKLIYQTHEETCVDENTGGNPSPIRFRRVRARLMTDVEDHRGYDTLELLRLTRDASQPQAPAAQDLSFVAPTMVLNGSEQLRYLVWELLQEVLQCRDAQARRIKETGFTFNNMQIAHLESVLRLQTLNRHAPILRSLYEATAGAAGVTPYALYLALSSFLGDLASLRLQHTDFEEVGYKHEDAWPVFELLCKKIRTFLLSSEQDKTMDVPFVQEGRYLTAKLEDKHLNLPITCYYLSVNTKDDPTRLKTYLEDEKSFKLLSRAMVESNQLVPGVKLIKPVWTPPSLAQGIATVHIFQLDIRNTPELIWRRILEDKRMAIVRIAAEQATFGVNLASSLFTLRMTPRPEEGVV